MLISSSLLPLSLFPRPLPLHLPPLCRCHWHNRTPTSQKLQRPPIWSQQHQNDGRNLDGGNREPRHHYRTMMHVCVCVHVCVCLLACVCACLFLVNQSVHARLCSDYGWICACACVWVCDCAYPTRACVRAVCFSFVRAWALAIFR